VFHFLTDDSQIGTNCESAPMREIERIKEEKHGDRVP
jgi:hypothetical protein